MKRINEVKIFKWLFVSSCAMAIFVVLLFFVKMESENDLATNTLERENESNNVVMTNDFSKSSIEHLVDDITGIKYDEKSVIICLSTESRVELSFIGKIGPYKGLEANERCFFLSHQTEWISFQRKDNQIINVPQYFLQKTDMSAMVFVDGDGHFVRYDGSYICSQQLLQNKNGICAPKSYYLD